MITFDVFMFVFSLVVPFIFYLLHREEGRKHDEVVVIQHEIIEKQGDLIEYLRKERE